MTVSIAVATGRRRVRSIPPARRVRRWLSARLRRLRGARSDAGMSTAEYAIGTVAACAIAAALYKLVTSGVFTDAFTELVNRAFHVI
ncbi:DUF4244 domain-containing protein [Kitasatospora sp. NPDC001175]|uniref:DUF4244 domain-containing protein n=1 Tax=Kitasatospora sp. NPDC001175 TaxID=3157103 RepID=UPI003D091F53